MFLISVFLIGIIVLYFAPITMAIGEDFFFSQRDPQWSNDLIIDENGLTQGTIEGIGAPVTCCGMVLKYYGIL